jgi:hypothetical protein
MNGITSDNQKSNQGEFMDNDEMTYSSAAPWLRLSRTSVKGTITTADACFNPGRTAEVTPLGLPGLP